MPSAKSQPPANVSNRHGEPDLGSKNSSNPTMPLSKKRGGEKGRKGKLIYIALTYFTE